MFRTGHGPAVIVIAEIPGITPDVIAVARRIADLGCTVALPHLFGVPGRDPQRRGAASMVGDALIEHRAGVHLARVHRARHRPHLAGDRLAAGPRPDSLHDECGGPGVGVVGMCFTGGFALGMIADAPVLAPVLSQPSLPFAVTGSQKAAVGLSPEDLTAAADACAARDITVLGFRFTDDRAVPPQRFETLRRVLGDRFVGVEIDSSKGNQWGHPRVGPLGAHDAPRRRARTTDPRRLRADARAVPYPAAHRWRDDLALVDVSALVDGDRPRRSPRRRPPIDERAVSSASSASSATAVDRRASPPARHGGASILRPSR